MHQNNTPQRPCWNIFARELQHILHSHGLTLGHLDDRVGIHREKVRRLIRSLDTPPGLPILNTEEILQISDTLHLTRQELLRLRAAMLANAIQRTLSEHIHQDNACLAMEQIFPIILQSLEARQDTKNLGNKRTGDIEGTEDVSFDTMLKDVPPPDTHDNTDEEAEDAGFDTMLKDVLDAFENGTYDLQMSRGATSHNKRIRKAYHAQFSFSEAKKQLDSLKSHIGQPTWQYYSHEIQLALSETNAWLATLGE